MKRNIKRLLLLLLVAVIALHTSAYRVLDNSYKEGKYSKVEILEKQVEAAKVIFVKYDNEIADLLQKCGDKCK